MAVNQSAGLLLFRRRDDGIKVLIAHMGGPFWAKKDAGAWSIPKGEYDETEEPLAAARREFEEELGSPPPPASAAVIDLGEIRQRNGKRVRAWAIEGDLDPATVVSATFDVEWPRGSGVIQRFPEIDRAGWFTPEAARTKLVAAQAELLDRLVAHEAGRPRAS